MSKNKKKNNKLSHDQRLKMLLTPCKTEEQFKKWIKYHLGLHLPDQTVSRYADTNPFSAIWEIYKICVWNDNPEDIDELLLVAGRGSGKTLGMAVVELMVLLHNQRDIVHVGAVQAQADRCYNYIKNFLYNRQLKSLIAPSNKPEEDRILEKANMSKSIFNINSEKVTLEVLPCTLKACPTVDQQIVTRTGNKAAGDIKKGDILLSPLGEVEVLDNKILEKECVEVELEDGTIICGTLDHKILTDKGWVELKNLTSQHDVITDKDYKFCKKCKQYKKRDLFTKRKRSKDGLRNHCRKCRNEMNLKNYYKKPLNRSKCTQCNKDRNTDKQRVHKDLCQACYRYHQRNSTLQKRDKICVNCGGNSSIKWYSGPLCRKCYRVSTYADRKNSDSNWYLIERIKNNLRSRISKIVSGQIKQGSAIKDLGCSIDNFKQYLESRWQPGMSWDNYGFNGWHIDHIKPLNSFNLNQPEELKKACHYSNLQPLWAKDNLKKSGKYEG